MKFNYVSMIPFTTKKQARKAEITGIAVGVLAGAIVGAAAGILFAPASGKETRAFIKDKAEEACELVKDKTTEAYGCVKEKAQDIVGKVKEKLSKAEIEEDASDAE